MYKTIGMVAHVDAGKTTLLEQILFNTNSIRMAGRVDNKDTILDYHSIERQRGITVFSDQTIAQYNDSTYYLIDTPGHVDFSTEMERSIRILDCAVIILSAVEGIEGHTQTVWKLLRKYNIPTIFFVNKLDRAGADFEKVCSEIHNTFTKDLCIFVEPNNNETFTHVNPLVSLEKFDDSIIEFIAERNELIMNQYINDENIDYSILIKVSRDLISSNKLFPCVCGSGLKNIGVDNLLFILDKFVITNYEDTSDFSGTVYKIRHDNLNNKETFIKVLSGILQVKDIISHQINDNSKEEKINQIKIYKGNQYILKNHLNAGELGAVIGINSAFIGEGLGSCSDFNNYSLIPTLRSKVIFDEKVSPKDVLEKFKILTSEDPSINAIWVDELNEIQINVMGLIQLEILKYIVKERFDIDVDFGTAKVIYKETITNETYGFGHFEPYKHFSEVEFKITPNNRGEGITFSSECSTDILHIRWQRLVEKNIMDSCKRGILTGSLITDIHITLISGRAHVKHTSGGDFRQATFRAMRQGIEKVNNILLEPYYDFNITISQELSGKVMTDIVKMNGTFNIPMSDGMNSTITGKIPVSSSMYYPAELASFSRGKGKISLTFSCYDICHDQENVIEKIDYNKDKDPKYTSNSIYCSHGKTYSVLGKDI